MVLQHKNQTKTSTLLMCPAMDRVVKWDKQSLSERRKIMTANIINHFANLEKERANRASEELRQRELAELQRHNLAAEQEQVRHNVLSENISKEQLFETARANRANEGIKQQTNYITYSLGSREQDTKAGTLDESQRHNEATETEAVRHNEAVEQETRSHDYVTESQTRNAQDLEQQRQEETKRHNQQQEKIDWYKTGVKLAGDMLNFGLKVAFGLSGIKVP